MLQSRSSQQRHHSYQQQNISKNMPVVEYDDDDNNNTNQTNSPLVWLFTENATAKILSFLMTMKEYSYSETEIAENAEVSKNTAIKDIKRFEELGMIKLVRVVGKAKLYQVNEKSPLIQYLNKFELHLATVRNYHELLLQGYQKEAEELIKEKNYFPKQIIK